MRGARDRGDGTGPASLCAIRVGPRPAHFEIEGGPLCSTEQTLFIHRPSKPRSASMASRYLAWAQRKRVEAEGYRRVAAQMSLHEDRERLLRHAQQLEEEASDLEQKALASKGDLAWFLFVFGNGLAELTNRIGEVVG